MAPRTKAAAPRAMVQKPNATFEARTSPDAPVPDKARPFTCPGCGAHYQAVPADGAIGMLRFDFVCPCKYEAGMGLA